MSVGYVTHEEATIKHFMEEPEFADYLLAEVKQDGNKEEIAYFQNLCDEAQERRNKAVSTFSRWTNVAENVKITEMAMA